MAPEPLAGPGAGRPAEAAVARWWMRLEVDEPDSRVAAAVDEGGTIIGLASAGATRDDDAPTAWELYSINVLAAEQGAGVADDLIRAVAGAAGESDTTVWVLSDNERAQGFYRRHGFRVDGATQVHDGTGSPEIRMVRRRADR